MDGLMDRQTERIKLMEICLREPLKLSCFELNPPQLKVALDESSNKKSVSINVVEPPRKIYAHHI